MYESDVSLGHASERFRASGLFQGLGFRHYRVCNATGGDSQISWFFGGGGRVVEVLRSIPDMS